jgi:hypothetical protein
MGRMGWDFNNIERYESRRGGERQWRDAEKSEERRSLATWRSGTSSGKGRSDARLRSLKKEALRGLGWDRQRPGVRTRINESGLRERVRKGLGKG